MDIDQYAKTCLIQTSHKYRQGYGWIDMAAAAELQLRGRRGAARGNPSRFCALWFRGAYDAVWGVRFENDQHSRGNSTLSKQKVMIAKAEIIIKRPMEAALMALVQTNAISIGK